VAGAGTGDWAGMQAVSVGWQGVSTDAVLSALMASTFVSRPTCRSGPLGPSSSAVVMGRAADQVRCTSTGRASRKWYSARHRPIDFQVDTSSSPGV
jgi:hypothetical protein